MFKALIAIGKFFIGVIINGLKSVGNMFAGLGVLAKIGLDAVKTAVSNWWEGVKSIFSNVKEFFRNLFSGIQLPSLPSLPGRGDAVTRNKGGLIPGSVSPGFGSDSVHALLTPGELVVPVPVVRQLKSNPSGAMQSIQALLGHNASGMSSAPAPTYSMPSSQIAGNAGGIVINAPISQQINVTGMAASNPVSAGQKIATAAQNGIARGLSNAARQVPQRVAKPA